MSTGAATTVLDRPAWGFLPGYPLGVLVTLTPAQQRAIDAARAAQQKLDRIRRDEAAALRERDAALREHGDVIRELGWAAFEKAVGADVTTGEPVIDRDTARKVIGNP